MVAKKVEEKGKGPESSSTEKQTQELGVVGIADVKLEAVLGQFEQKRIEDSQKAATSWFSERDNCPV